jgi:hypothetical protein
MSVGIKQPIQDILARLTSLQVNNGDGGQMPLFARIWNNQIHLDKEGKSYSYPTPAAFVEVITPATYEMVGQGVRSADISFRIHLVHVFFNNDGTYEQDLIIFDLRDQVIASLSDATGSGWKPTNCTPLVAIAEEQDYNHDQVYHYMIDFIAGFIDTTAQKQFLETTPPTPLELDITVSEEGGQMVTDKFIINGKVN